MASWWEQQFKSRKSWALVLIILFIALLGVGVLCTQQKEKYQVSALKPIKDGFFGCVIPTQNPTTKAVLSSWRGSNYLLDASADKPKTEQGVDCILTGWGLSHVALYFFIGFVAPKLFIPILLASIIWELMEALMQCHDALDIVWNLSGFILGASVRIAMGI